jgi:amino acid transporter
MNLQAGLLIPGVTVVLVSGVRLSSRSSQVVTAIRLAVVLLVIVVGIAFINAANWSPFIPPADGAPSATAVTAVAAPWVGGIIAGLVIAVIAAFVPLTTSAELVNIGTLAAFVVVSLGVIALRRTRPRPPAPFSHHHVGSRQAGERTSTEI